MSLIDKKTQNVIAIETFASLEDIDTQIQEVSLTNDFLSYIELPSIDKGEY